MQKPIEIKVDNQSIRGILENPNSDKLIILVHGFSGNMHGPNNIFDKLSQRLQENGIAVLRFNFRGTKPSDMEQQEMTIESETADLKAAIKFAKSYGFKKIGALGESMGGTVLVNAYELSLAVLIFWYAAFDLIDTAFRELFTKKAQKELAEKGLIEMWDFRIGKKFVEEIKNVKLYDKMKEIHCPILFLHGDSDADVPCEQSKKAFQLANEPKELHIIKGADHCFKNEQDEAIELTLNFLKRYF